MLGSKIKLKTGAAIGAGSAGSLKTASAISATLQTVTDTAGNNSALQISSSAVGFAPTGTSIGSINSSGLILGNGTITQNGVLTVKGLGGNIVSFRNSANVERVNIDLLGNINCSAAIIASSIVYGSSFGVGGGFSFIASQVSGIVTLFNSASNNFERLNFGGNSVNEPSIKKNGSGFSLRTATDSANVVLTAASYTSDNLSSGTLTTARPVKFGDRATITEAGFIALGLNRQIAIEHNGVVYYIPVSTTLIP
jgi:hypothetical protein